MAYLEEVLPEFKKGAKIRRKSWPENLCISLRDSCGINIAFYDVKADDWESCQRHIDWDYIIKNKCLCWFWDDNRDDWVVVDILRNIDEQVCRPFLTNSRQCWENCRPVRKDEVAFYEDKKDD